MSDFPSQKICPSCKIPKSLHEFGEDKSKKDKKCIYCFPCSREKTNRWLQTSKGKAYRDKVYKNKSYKTSATLKYEYGITLERYEEILASQDGKCAVCNSAPTYRRLDVDHCHETGKVRGLLCKNCNTGLGCFKDNLDLLKLAVKYLEAENDLRLPTP